MPPLNWTAFTQLSGSAESNFETLCRALVRRQYAQFGDFVALASQPGVEFHLKIRASCSLGEPGRWYGWQCRWYDLPSGRALGNARRRKIEKAITTTEKVLPELTDWVLWTRHPLTKGDQDWFYALKTKMQLNLWTALEVEEHLSGKNEVFRSTYFGELVLTTETLAGLHEISVAPIRRRWTPETHQPIDAERSLRRMLGESGSWEHLAELADQLKTTAASISTDSEKAGTLADAANEVAHLTLSYADSLLGVFSCLRKGDLDLLRQLLTGRPPLPSPKLGTLPRQLRAARCPAALLVTNAIADCRLATGFLNEVDSLLGTKLIAILADAGCGKTQLAAQITAATSDRPCGILLHGRDLHASHDLNELARKIVINAVPVASMEALVAAVDAAGQRAHRRIPIVIDALNEAEDPRKWKSFLAALNQTLLSYAHVLVVCTVRTVFATEALPLDVNRIEIPDFGHDSLNAIRRYFSHYLINARDAELPIGLLKHPLTLRLFCEVTNQSRQHMVGIEAMPQSLTALFDRYLAQAAERIADLAPQTHRYYEQDVRSALDEIGTALWQEKGRSIDLAILRDRLGDAARPWNASIVNALEQEGILLRYPGEPPAGPTVAGVYDALAGHLIASAILAKYGRTGFEGWLKDRTTVSAFDGALPDQHPLASDTFRALVGLVPRRLNSQQLWALIEPPLRTPALRAAANLEAAYLDAATVSELRKLVVQMPLGERDLFDRLWQTRGAPSHPLNADFLDSTLRPMTLASRDLRWTEWIRRHHKEVMSDVGRIEERWRHRPQRPESERLRARWIMWTLSSTVRELRDRATRTLYWFGRGDPVGLFRLTVHSLAINDPYVSERTLASAYGVCMALHCRPRHSLFRAKLLPTFAKSIYRQMFAPGAPHSTTHALSRDYVRRIVDLARLHQPSLLSKTEVARTIPPFKEGGIRLWESISDPNEGKYRDGNSPLGMDFENYTIGSLVRSRRNYDYQNEEYKRVVGQITWRIYQLGYSLEAFWRNR